MPRQNPGERRSAADVLARRVTRLSYGRGLMTTRKSREQFALLRLELLG